MKKEFEGYFEDFEPDIELVSSTRTITEGDLANYIAISGDYNQIYCSDEFAKRTLFQGRVLPSPMVFVIATGLFVRIKGVLNHSLAALGQQWEFPSFVRVGDTLRLKVTFPSKRETRHKDRGIVSRRIEVVNQAGKIAAIAEGEMMIERRVS